MNKYSTFALFGFKLYEYIKLEDRKHLNLLNFKVYYFRQIDNIKKRRILCFRSQKVDPLLGLEIELNKTKKKIENLNKRLDRIEEDSSSSKNDIPQDYYPKVSIIVPIFNNEDYLRECLESIRNQSFKYFEVICVDDGSTDSSARIVDYFAKKDLRFHYLFQQNQGAGSARNLGIEKSRGEFLMFLDGDDIFEPEFVEKMYEKVYTYDADIAICKANKLRGTEIKKARYIDFNILQGRKSLKLSEIPEKAFQIFQLVPWNKIYRADFVKKEGIRFQNLKNSNDTFFVGSCLLLAKKISIVNKALVNYRIHETSLVRKKDEYPLCFLEALAAIKQLMLKKEIFSTYEKSYINRVVDNIFWNYRQIKEETQRQINSEVIAFCKSEKLDKYDRDYFFDPKAYDFIKELMR